MPLSVIKLATNLKDKVVSKIFFFTLCAFTENIIRFSLFTAASSVKKQISVSQHSSISQADDCSSPYARVRSQAHAYDKVRPAEHPYAQVKSIGDNVNRPNTSNSTAPSNNLNAENNNSNDIDSLSRRSSRESLLDSVDGRQVS